jgi:hypothetical protein
VYVDLRVLVKRDTSTARYVPAGCQCSRTSDTEKSCFWRSSVRSGARISTTRAGTLPPPPSTWYAHSTGADGDQAKSTTPSSLMDFLSSSAMVGVS